jgi:hypothetical protein
MKTIPEDELLDLLNKAESEAIEWLSHHDHIILDCVEKFSFLDGKVHKVPVWESLADCAERLWEKAKIKTIFPIAAVYEHLYPEIEVNQANRCSMMEWLAMDSKPIHRIVAAIIALQRSGVEI